VARDDEYRVARASTGIATGAMLAIARITGETAPLLFTALNSRFYNFYYDQPMASLTVQIFNTRPDRMKSNTRWLGRRRLILVGLIY
jgi:phosphate transport system permease protein